MCFKKLKSLARLCKPYEPEDFEVSATIEIGPSFYNPDPQPITYDIDINILSGSDEESLDKDDWDFELDANLLTWSKAPDSGVTELLQEADKVIKQSKTFVEGDLTPTRRSFLIDIPEYKFNPLCNLKGHDWIKCFVLEIFYYKYCQRCWKITSKEDS